MTLPGFFPGTGMPDSGWWEALWPDPSGVLAKLGIARGMSVIDLCAGDGWFTLAIARVARIVYAIDIDYALLETARVRLKRADVGNCRLIEGDAVDIAKLVPETVDYVFLANAFHGVPDRPRLARAVHETLNPSGLFAVVNWHARPREETIVLGEPRGPASNSRMTPEATIAAIEPSGFETIKLAEVSPYHYAAVLRRLQ